MRTRLLLLCICVGSYLYSVAQPSNNPCGMATPITNLDGTCNTSEDMMLATEDIGPGSCTVGSNKNVWFSFTAIGVSAEITVTNAIGTPEITIVEFPTTPCSGADAQEVDCVTGTTLVTDNTLTIGNTYYVMVAFSNNADGFFDICIDNPNPAPNDNCITATPLTLLDDACYTSNNDFPSTDVLIPGCFTGSTYNVWFSFVAQGVSLDVNIPAGGPGVSQVAVIDFATNCVAAGAVTLGCATGTNHIVLDNELTIGDLYYIVVGFQNSDFDGNGIGSFELCVDNPEPAPNDDCDMAVVVPPSVLSDPTTCYTTIAGVDLNNDWPSTDVGLFGCWDANFSTNIWYSFVAQGPDVQITIDPSFPEDAQIALVEFTGAPCEIAGAILLRCVTNNYLEFNDDLVIGNTYYFAVGFDGDAVGDFCMNVFNPVPPPNDLPCNAIALDTDGGCESGTTIYASSEGYFVPGTCQTSVQSTVWYTLSLNDPDNVGFEIDFSFINAPNGAEVSIILWEVTDCNQPGTISFFNCGAPPSDVLMWGPIDENTTYYLSVSTSTVNEADFTLCVDEVPPCFENDICAEATPIPDVMSDMAFVCIDGCNLFADPELFNNSCGVGNFPTVWFQVQTDGAATLMNIQVNSDDFDAPTISLFWQTTDCDALTPVPLTTSNLPCVVGSNGEAEAFGSDVGASSIYYIAVSSLNNVGGDFSICVNTISSASNCVTSRDIEITGRSSNGPLEGPFFPGETVSICMNVDSYTAANNGCQWFQGLIPVFGNGWDPSSFDGNGQPLNATVNGNPIPQAGNGLYGSAQWDWFTDVDYHHDHVFYQLGDFDGNGTIDMCNILYDPDCPNTGGLMGGCCNPCWGAPLGTILPGGWFAYGINGSCNIPGPPIRVDWGDGNTCGGGMGPWAFCFDLNVREYPDCLEDVSTMTLSLGFFTTADGETGAWTGSASVCNLDQPAFVTLPMCCSELMEGFDMLDPICSGQQMVYSIDEPDVDYWEWTVDAGIVTGATPGSGGPGTTIINTLTNGGSDPETVTYTFLGFAGGACPVFQKEVTIDVYPKIQVTLTPLVMCSTPTEPYEIIPDVIGGSGNYEYQWSPGGETTPTIMVPNPVNGTLYTVSVTDEVGCFGTAKMAITVYTTFPVDIDAPITEQCVQEGDINLEASAMGGMDPYNFEWTLPDQTNQTTEAITTSLSGQHLVIVTDTEGCVGKDSVVISFFPTPEVYIDAVDGALAICEGESTELAGVASMGTSPYLYEWDTPEGLESGKNIEAFTPGLYTVTVEDAHGCTNSAEIEIEAQPEPMPDLGPDLIVCDFEDPVELIVTPQFEDYAWSIGSGADGLESIEVYNAGIYTVTVTNEFGCTGDVSMEILTFPQPPFVMPDTFEYCPGGSVTIDADDFGGPWDNYIWLQCPLCINEITVSTPGIYSVIVYDFNGCTATQQFEVIENSSVMAGLDGDQIMCTGETITLSALPGFNTYEWSPNAGGSTTNTADVTSIGNYYVTVEDNMGCVGIDSIEIVSGDFVASINGPTAICANVLATITAQPAGGTYLWSTNEVTQTIQVDDGTHTVTVTSSDGCTAVASTTIIETPFIPVITGKDSICRTSETSVLDAGGPYASYTWSANTGSAITQTVTVSSAGTYTVTIVDASGCVGTAAFTVANYPVPFVSILGSPDFCVGGSTQMNATPGYVSYEWNNAEVTPTITINTPGAYSVTITDDNGCTNTSSTTVNNPYQEMVDISGSFVFCPGDQATLEVPAGYASVLWSTGESTDLINVATEGDISVIVVDVDGCIAYDTVTTEANALLSPNITGIATICDNGTTVLNAGPGFDNYIWSANAGSATTQTVTVNGAGTYSVTVSSNSGCMGEDDFVVTAFSSPSATVTPTATACDILEPGGPTTIIDFNALVTAGDMGGGWTQNSGPSTVNLTNLSAVNFNGLSAGTYTFTYRTASAVPPCLDQSYPLTVTIQDCSCPQVLLGMAPDLCNRMGTLDLNSIVDPQTPSGGTWSILTTPPGSNPATITPPATFVGTMADPGTYTLQYHVSGLASYCNADATVDIEVQRTPDAGVAAVPVDFCFGENQVVNLSTLLIGADGGGEWNETSQFPSSGGAFNATAGSFDVSGQAPGTYTFVYLLKGTSPCPDDMTTVEVVIEANPIADAGSSSTIDCITPTAQLGGSGTSIGADFMYTWTTTDGILSNANQPIATAMASGTYVLTVVNIVTGCSATDQVVIDQIGTFPTSIEMLVTSPDCEGDAPGSMQVTFVMGGTAPYSYSLNGATPVASPVFNNLPAGDYTIEVSDAIGCKVSDTFTIEELVVVDLEIINFVHDSLVFDLGDSIKFSYIYAGSSTTPDSLVWKIGDSVLCTNCLFLEMEAYLASTITLEAYDVRGCFIKETVTFQVVRKRDVYIPNVFSPNGDGLNDIFTLFSDSDVKEITLMEIYSRWGELVYRKSGLLPNDPNTGWDGTFDGDELNPGVYVYRIEVIYGDDVKADFAGDITIVK